MARKCPKLGCVVGVCVSERAVARRVLTQGGHLFRQVGAETSKQTAIGQQVEGGVAPHGVEGKRVDSRWEAGHVTHLSFPVGRHGCTQLTPRRSGQRGWRMVRHTQVPLAPVGWTK